MAFTFTLSGAAHIACNVHFNRTLTQQLARLRGDIKQQEELAEADVKAIRELSEERRHLGDERTAALECLRLVQTDIDEVRCVCVCMCAKRKKYVVCDHSAPVSTAATLVEPDLYV